MQLRIPRGERRVADERRGGAHAAIANAVAGLGLIYAGVLTVGLLTLPSSQQPISGRWFTAMEMLTLATAPAMVALMAVLHARASPDRRAFGVVAIAFMAICATITSCVHFAILTLGREPAFVAQPWADRVFSFRWPSLAYALDILAWDVFFPLAALCAAATVQGAGLLRAARALLYASAGLAFAGLLGLPLGDMNVRNIGILGYAAAFPIAAALLGRAYGRADVDAAGHPTP